MCVVTFLRIVYYVSRPVRVSEISVLKFHKPLFLVYIFWQEEIILLLQSRVNTYIDAIQTEFAKHGDSSTKENGEKRQIIPIR